MSKLTPFHPRLSAMTDRWMDLFGYAAPSVVTDTLEEYRACREAAALMDFSMLRKVYLDGEGAQELVDAIVCRDVSTLPAGRIAYGALTDEQGKMVDDCTVMALASDRVQFCGANDADYAAFSARAGGSSVQVSERTDEVAHLCLQGPRSREILQTLTGSDLSNTAFPYYTYRTDVQIAEIPVFMTRLGYTAELGYELWVENDRALELWDALVAAGLPAGMRVIGMDALDLFRIEGGFIIGGVEYDETVSPFECGLGWSVDLTKPRFRGREALEADRDSAHRRLVSIRLDSGGAAASSARLTAIDGTTAGLVTQAVASPFLDGATLGLGRVDRDYATPGTQLIADVEGASVQATVVPHPVYDPQRHRAKER
jgi:glycine cleavage system T protein (aminomethyltransferase)